MPEEEKTHQDEESGQVEDRLLTHQERILCAQIAMREAPHCLRARALLALDDGVTHSEAAEQSGLTVGQVRYWLGRYRQDGMDIFPKQLTGEFQAAQESSSAEKTGDAEVFLASGQPESKGKKAAKSKKKAKGAKKKGKKGKSAKKKGKKNKKKKKNKKAKKGKKSKKGKGGKGK